MNLNVSESLKTVMSKTNKFNPKSKMDKNDGESFLKSLNKFLEKNKLKDDKTLGKASVDKKENLKDKMSDNDKEDKIDDNKDDALGSVNISSLIGLTNKHPAETILNKEVSTEIIGEIKPQLQSIVEGEELSNLGSLDIESKIEVSLKNELETELETETTGTRFNFNIEEAKNNLAKALNKEVENLKEPSGLEGEILNIKEEASGKLKDSEVLNSGRVETKEVDITKVDLLEGKVDSTLIDDGEAVMEDSILMDGVKDTSKELGTEEELIEGIKSKSTIEKPKTLETNFIFNRIQNSFVNVGKIENSLSSQNLQGIEDSMIEFMKVSKEGDTSVMKVRLYPEELGSIDISLKLSGGKLIADIIVESEKIKALFLNSSNILNKALVEQNIAIKDINITVNENLNSFENFKGETNERDRQGNPQSHLNRNKNGDGSLNTSPLDDMRIKNINKQSGSLDILV
ncbi:flagellar hook-length control protein FliK [Tissierella creatinophila]|uniref:Flagellar hook-length control protein FliK n=1 Tax=Tissierella creatinophila DSM 6911 TaxID=1123403 RepID=A0A1U7M948_TISCR|nr:flagellar hook-length control protein FliK [Tissierella creatinophila]OLS03770.1 flagellar hook-length control protein FliK [Tissierella creatinophila DSM 6911]